MVTYAQRREAIYTPLRQEGVFTWDLMDGQEYALATYHLIPRSFRTEIAHATEQLGHIFTKMISVIRRGEVELLQKLGIPPSCF